MIRAFLLPLGLAPDAFRDLASRAAAATVRTGKCIAYFTDASAFRAQSFPTSKARQKGGFINTVGYEACDRFQPPTCLDSILWQSPSTGCVGHLLAYGPETAVPPTSFAYCHSILVTTNAKKVLGIPETVVVWMLVIRVRQVMDVAIDSLRAGRLAELFDLPIGKIVSEADR